MEKLLKTLRGQIVCIKKQREKRKILEKIKSRAHYIMTTIENVKLSNELSKDDKNLLIKCLKKSFITLVEELIFED